MKGLAGRVAVVTGAARMRGIGRSIALRLGAEGCAVAVVGSAREPSTFPPAELAVGWRGADSVAEEITNASGTAVAINCDLTKADEINACVTTIVERLGSVDILVNNAAIGINSGSAELVELDAALWQQMIDINLSGVYLMTKAVGAVMRESARGGAIVNLSSTAGRQAMARSGAYSATKWAVIGLTQQLALELARDNIRVNCICPGATATDMTEAFWSNAAASQNVDASQVRKGTADRVPLGRLGLAEEQAAAVAFLASDEASYITGQTLNVDGGIHMD